MDYQAIKSHESTGIFLILLMYALFASIFIIGKQGIENCEPCFFIGFRMCIAGVILTAMHLCKNSKSLQAISLDRCKCLLYIAFFSIYLANVLEFWALQKLPPSTVCFYYSLSPFFAAAIAWINFREKISAKQFLGLIIGIASFFFIPAIFKKSSIDIGFLNLGLPEIAMLFAVISSVLGWSYLKKAIQKQGISIFMANGISMFLGGILCLAHSAVTEQWHPIPVKNISTFLYHEFLMTLISNGICYSLYGYLLTRYSNTWLSFCGLITPIFSMTFGYIFINEQITYPFLISMPCVFSGLFLFYQDELKKEFTQNNAKTAIIT
jgi:drug/metabolite transporter (DMT)-like permease